MQAQAKKGWGHPQLEGKEGSFPGDSGGSTAWEHHHFRPLSSRTRREYVFASFSLPVCGTCYGISRQWGHHVCNLYVQHSLTEVQANLLNIWVGWVDRNILSASHRPCPSIPTLFSFDCSLPRQLSPRFSCEIYFLKLCDSTLIPLVLLWSHLPYLPRARAVGGCTFLSHITLKSPWIVKLLACCHHTCRAHPRKAHSKAIQKPGTFRETRQGQSSGVRATGLSVSGRSAHVLIKPRWRYMFTFHISKWHGAVSYSNHTGVQNWDPGMISEVSNNGIT